MIAIKHHLPFILALLMLIAAWGCVTAFTWHAPASDGPILGGFPLPFYSEGGMCAEGYCKARIQYLFLLVDLAMGIPFPFGIQKICECLRKGKPL